jgi:subtilisin family serine protease
MIVAVVLFLSMMQIPYNALFAEENNYALAYFQHPQEIDTYKQYQPNILEIYSDHVLCKLSKPLEDYLQTNDIFYQTIGDITRFHFDQYEFSSNSQKDVLYPAKFTEELSKLSFAEPAIYLLQFIGPVKTSWIELLKSYNIELYMQLDNYAYLTKGRGIDMHNLKTLSFIRSTGLFPPSLKIPEIALSMDQEELINIDVNVSNDFDIEVFQKYFRHPTEKTLHTAFSGKQYLRLIDVPVRKLTMLSYYPSVILITPYIPMEPMNAEAAKVVGIRGDFDENILTDDIPTGLRGEGEIVGVADTGLSTGDPLTIHPAFTAPTFSDKVIGTYPPGLWGDYHGHGTHVSGTVLGTGVGHSSGTLRFRGMAPEAKLVIQNFLGNQDMYQPIPTIFQESYNAGSRIHNNSWGSYEFYGTYDTSASECDEWVWNHKDMSIIKSAGNDRDDWYAYFGDPFHRSLGGISAAKNLIVLGASQNNYPSDPYPCYYQRMANFSSIGPTHDNRIKPDVVAPGMWLVSTKIASGYTDDDSNYFVWGGTSMSAPVTTGAMTLFREYYRKVKNIPPQNIYTSLLKATLINGCITEGLRDHSQYTSYWPNSDDLLSIPSPICGWGRVNAKNSLYPETGTWFHYQNIDGLQPGEEDVYYVNVTDATTPLKVTLAWTDYPGTPKPPLSTESDLINDLNLMVFSYDEEVRYRGNQLHSYHHNSFNLGQPFESIKHTIAYDTVNNVEVVHLPVPRTGVYQIVVRAHGENPYSQSYSMVTSGDMFQTVRPTPQPPLPPYHFEGKPTCESNQLKWQASIMTAYPVSHYEIYRAPVSGGIPQLIATVDKEITSYEDFDVIYDTKYYYYVQAIDTEGYASNPTGVIVCGEATPPSPSFIWAVPSTSHVVLHWSPARENTCPVDSYQVYRSCTAMPGLTPIATTNSTIRTWADMNVQPGQTYCYYVQAVDSKGKSSNPSNITQAIIPIPENEVFISAELNKKSYSKNDTVIMKVKLTNAGQVDCTDQRLILALPVGLAYSTNDRVAARIEGNGDVVFDIGFLQRNSSYTLSIQLIVEENVSREHSLKAILQAYCGTTFQNSREMSILLRPSKNQNQSLDSSIRLGGTRQNPETGRATIDQDQPLEFSMTITGGEAPYTVRIDWGDGSNLLHLSDVKYGQEIKENHSFESKGSITIKIQITDSFGRRKITTIQIEVV